MGVRNSGHFRFPLNFSCICRRLLPLPGPVLLAGKFWYVDSPPSPEFVHLFAALSVRKSAGNRGEI
ncbi:hypothetical protein SLEP1_g48264 [Rubroshorea leprosula]|uniref:Uncharacterized protein n=1 Tax=Rubroshorea leprosula TaxID=152421 RepID=A0AAV5LT32_9ROSI|nr:hypothetical protein SLEP1_g48264 [Rubroshorea leprosula]